MIDRPIFEDGGGLRLENLDALLLESSVPVPAPQPIPPELILAQYGINPWLEPVPPPVAAAVTNAVAELAAGTGAASGAATLESMPAGLASGTGAALAVTGKQSVPAGFSSGTGTAGAVTPAFRLPSGLASGTGTAPNASITEAFGAGLASGTGSASSATTKELVPATLASGAGNAPNATVTTGTIAPAGNAAGTGLSQTPTTKGSVPTTIAAATGTANNATAITADDAPAATATGTGAAQTPTPKELIPVGHSSGTGVAANATVTTVAVTNAPAGLSLGTGIARTPTTTVRAGIPSTGGPVGFLLTEGGGVAAATNAPAATATATGSAQTPTTKEARAAGNAAGSGTSYQATVDTIGDSGWPDASNTGTLGASLTTINVTGTLWRTSTDGAALYTTQNIGGNTYHVFTNKAFTATTGYVYIDDPYVRFDHCSFTASGLINNAFAVVQQSSASLEIRFDDCNVDGGAAYHNRGISGDYGTFTIRRCNFTRNGEAAVEKNDRNGLFSMDVQDSYIHEVKGWVPGAHTDGLQMDGGLNFTAIHNTVWIEPYNGTDGDTSTASNSCIGVWSTLADMAGDILIDNNQLAGGGTVIYCEQQSYSMLGSVTISNNVFVRGHFPSLQGAQYNPTSGHAAIWYVLYPGGRPADVSGAGAGWINNKWEDGTTVTLAVAITST